MMSLRYYGGCFVMILWRSFIGILKNGLNEFS
jgi:hypothetical protein